MNEELMRKISDALDAPGGLGADAEFRARLEGDPAAAAYARDLEGIGDLLGGLRGDAELRSEADFERLAARIDAGLDDSAWDDAGFDDIGDPTMAPAFEDEVGEARSSGGDPAEGDLSGGPSAERLSARGEAASARPVTDSEVVDIASARRRRRHLFATIGGLAAAAAVGLGITAGLGLQPAAEPEAAMAPATTVMPGPAMRAAEPAESPAVATLAAEEEEELAFAEETEAAPGWFAADEAATEAEAEPAITAAAAATGGATAEAMYETRSRRGMGGSMAPGGGALPEGSAFPEASGGPAGGGGAGGTLAGRGGRAAPSAPMATAARRPAPAPPAAEPAVDSDGEVSVSEAQRALASATERVQRCIGRVREVARVRVSVRGRDGVVTDVSVEAPYAGTPEASCISEAVRGVRMPTSAQPSYGTGHAYRPAPIAGSGSSVPRAARSRARRAAPAAPAADPAFGR